MRELKFIKCETSVVTSTVKYLLQKNGMKQNKLADEIGMKESRISLIFQEGSDANFTVDQLYRISILFGVSMDYLVTGKENRATTSVKSICEFIVSMFDQFEPEIMDFMRTETIIEDPFLYGNNSEEKDVMYHTLFFPICWNDKRDKDYTDDRLKKVSPQRGEDSNRLDESEKINRFLDIFIPIHRSYNLGIMSEDEYRLTIDSVLEAFDKK